MELNLINENNPLHKIIVLEYKNIERYGNYEKGMVLLNINRKI